MLTGALLFPFRKEALYDGKKMLPVPNEGHRRRQKQRRRRFPWGSIATVILVVAVCVYAFTLFGDKESPENYQENGTTTQGPDDV